MDSAIAIGCQCQWCRSQMRLPSDDEAGRRPGARRRHEAGDAARPGPQDVPMLVAFSPAEACGGPGEPAGWGPVLEGEAPWETVLVPRGTSR